MKTKKTKSFDCVEMKHQAQQRMRAKMKGFSREEELAFFREGSEAFRRKIEEARKAAMNPGKSNSNE